MGGTVMEPFATTQGLSSDIQTSSIGRISSCYISSMVMSHLLQASFVCSRAMKIELGKEYSRSNSKLKLVYHPSYRYWLPHQIFRLHILYEFWMYRFFELL